MVLTRILGNPPLVYATSESQADGEGASEEMVRQQVLEMAWRRSPEGRALRAEKVRALQGKYADLMISSDDFLRMKYEQKDRW